MTERPCERCGGTHKTKECPDTFLTKEMYEGFGFGNNTLNPDVFAFGGTIKKPGSE